VDLKNAFNSLQRPAILEALEQRCPSILPWLRQAFQPAPMLVGREVIWSTRGYSKATPGKAKPTAGCSPGRAPESGAWGWGFPLVGPAGGGGGPRRRGGPLRNCGAWPPTWGETAARPDPVGLPRPVAQGQGVHVPVCGHEVRARVLGRRRPLLRRGGGVGATADGTAAGRAAGPGSWGAGVQEEGPVPPPRGRQQFSAPAQIHRPALGEASPFWPEGAQSR